jgi:hypothetical protein
MKTPVQTATRVHHLASPVPVVGAAEGAVMGVPVPVVFVNVRIIIYLTITFCTILAPGRSSRG